MYCVVCKDRLDKSMHYLFACGHGIHSACVIDLGNNTTAHYESTSLSKRVYYDIESNRIYCQRCGRNRRWFDILKKIVGYCRISFRARRPNNTGTL